MNRDVSLIAFGTFGIPNGFRQSIFLGDKDSFSKIKTFDLNTNAIQLFPESKIYSIRKELVNGNKTIAYSIYSFAKEKNSNRGGTFIGASILFNNIGANESLIKNCLDEFHHDLISNKNNIDDEVIQVHHSDALKIKKKPKDFDKLSLNDKEFGEIDFSPTNKDLLVYEIIKPALFHKVMPLLNVYDNIFFTNNPEIAKFSYEKQLIQLIQKQEGLDAEIAAFKAFKEEERKQKIKQAIAKIEREINQFEEDKLQYIQRNNNLIEVCKQQVLENDLQIKKFKQQYEDDNQQIQSAGNYLKNVGKLLDQHNSLLQDSIKEFENLETLKTDEILREIEKNKTDLEDAKRKLKIPTIVKLSDLKLRHSAAFTQPSKRDYSHDDNHRPKKSASKAGTYFIIVLFLLFAIAGGIFFYFFFDDSAFHLYR